MQQQQSKKNGSSSSNDNQNSSQASLVGWSNLLDDKCSFQDHYTCNQDATSLLDGIFNRSTENEKVSAPIEIDFVDQFLWNSPIGEDSSFNIQQLEKTSSFVQRQQANTITQLNAPACISSQVTVGSESVQSQSISSQLSKDYRKNLAGYIMKKVIRLLLSPKFSKRLERLCERSSVSVANFQRYLETSLPGLFGPNSIYELLAVNGEGQEEKAMKAMLLRMAQRTLRKRYTLEILREGRMKDYLAYMSVKNRGLLYFSQLLG